MYYILNDDTNQILDIKFDRPQNLQAEANFYGCPVFVIEGEVIHTRVKPEKEEA